MADFAPTHPGEILLTEFLEPLGISQYQIAKAIDYITERTEMALQRMEETGQVVRNAGGRWAIGNTATAQLNGHVATGGNGQSRSMPEAVDGSI